jgi:hypothetical protein
LRWIAVVEAHTVVPFGKRMPRYTPNQLKRHIHVKVSIITTFLLSSTINKSYAIPSSYLI